MRSSTTIAVLTVSILTAGLLAATPVTAAPAPPGKGRAAPSAAGLEVYTGELSAPQLAKLRALGLDHEDIATSKASSAGKVRVEVVLSGQHVNQLRGAGLQLAVKRIDGQPASARLRSEAAAGFTVFRSYSEPGGIRDELTKIAADNPGLTKLVTIGKSVQGKDILAVKVTKGAQRVRDGARPAVLYSSAQHAREWITPEMTRRLLHHYLDSYGKDREITRIVDTTELWFVPVANPDGYDWTFLPGNRMWRKNLRDNNGDGQTAPGDGVDPNRNFPYKWGYDNEGSSPDPGSETYRGPSAGSEPETQAFDGLMKRVGFEYLINYHSAAELLLYGAGWQVATPTPDDLIYEALAGDDETPAVPGYDPDISAELYTTNGDTDGQAHVVRGTLAFTPEMSTCESVSAADPADAWDPADCASGFHFPDDENLIAAEFAKNVPFALSVARSAHRPDDPVSAIGRAAPDMQVDTFTVSYGDPQPVAVWAKRRIRSLTLNYRINGGPVRTAPVKEWHGGERYGDDQDKYYAEYRGTVRGAKQGDRVQAWFSGTLPGRGKVGSERFTYRQAKDSSAKVLVLANEDYKGVNPTYPPEMTNPKYDGMYREALEKAGIATEAWDVDRLGVPHDLGVLSHFDAVVWYLGENRLTQDAEDVVTDTPSGPLTDAAVAERQQYLTLAVRDYLNEGGKLLHAGETAAYYGTLGTALGGIWYGLDGAPEKDCVVTGDYFADCLLLADDFSQYYLGAYNRVKLPNPATVVGTGPPLDGFGAQLGSTLDEAGAFGVTSDTLPADQFPQFRSWASADYTGVVAPFEPVEGGWYAAAVHQDDSYSRLSRTIDLGSATSAQLKFALSYDTETGYDNVIVEAHTVGADDWTTLAEAGGATDTGVPTQCEAGFLLEEHPFLTHYLTAGDPCTATGSSGSWNRLTGSSEGWQQLTFDLSAYAGKSVEVSVTYVTDPGSGGAGVFVDDTRLVVDGVQTAEGFETNLGPWAAGDPPAGSPAGGAAFTRSTAVLEVAAGVSTPDTLLLGFGIEQLSSPADRVGLLRRAMAHLLP